MLVKFKVGDTVYVNGRCPKWLLAIIQRRARKITALHYDRAKQCCYYDLGTNFKGGLGDTLYYPFRSYQLNRERIGHRPRRKRPYHFRNNGNLHTEGACLDAVPPKLAREGVISTHLPDSAQIACKGANLLEGITV